MSKILESPNTNSIDFILRNSIEYQFEKKPILLKRILQLLEWDVNFQLMQNHNKKEEQNLIEALCVIKKMKFIKNK